MFEINGIWESNKKMKIATGFSLEEVEIIFKSFQNEINIHLLVEKKSK